MSQNYWDPKNKSSAEKQYNSQIIDVEAGGLQTFMVQTYTWMMLGLALTGLMAVLTVSYVPLYNFIFKTPMVFFGLIIAEFAMVISFGVALRKGADATKLLIMFLAYSALNGMTLSAILLAYTYQSVAQTFFISAGMFGGMSLYGYVTKSDLTGMGGFARMGLWGLVIAMLVNLFFASSFMSLVISIIGVLVFTILTAYDTQKLKAYYYSYSGDGEGLKRVSLGGALTLYLDFINLFLFMLRLLGNRR